MLRITPKQTCDFWIQFEDRAIRETFNLNFKWLPRILPCLLLGPPIKSTADKISYFLFLLRLGRCSPTNWDLKVELGISKLASYRFISGIGILEWGSYGLIARPGIFKWGSYSLGNCTAEGELAARSPHIRRASKIPLFLPSYSSSLTSHSQIWFLT